MDETRIVKMVKRPAKSKPPRNRSVYDEVTLSSWNPFERIDPAILEAIHQRHQQNRITHVLETAEDALW